MMSGSCGLRSVLERGCSQKQMICVAQEDSLQPALPIVCHIVGGALGTNKDPTSKGGIVWICLRHTVERVERCCKEFGDGVFYRIIHVLQNQQLRSGMGDRVFFSSFDDWEEMVVNVLHRAPVQCMVVLDGLECIQMQKGNEEALQIIQRISHIPNVSTLLYCILLRLCDATEAAAYEHTCDVSILCKPDTDAMGAKVPGMMPPTFDRLQKSPVQYVAKVRRWGRATVREVWIERADGVWIKKVDKRQKNDAIRKDGHNPCDPSENLSFNLKLSAKELADCRRVVKPYEHQGQAFELRIPDVGGEGLDEFDNDAFIEDFGAIDPDADLDF